MKYITKKEIDMCDSTQNQKKLNMSIRVEALSESYYTMNTQATIKRWLKVPFALSPAISKTVLSNKKQAKTKKVKVY